MILIEPQCKGWEHNRANAGMIELLCDAYPDESITVYAEKDHIENIRRILSDCSQISYKKLNFSDELRTTSFEHKNDYISLLREVVEGENENKFLLLSTNKGLIAAINEISNLYRDKTFVTIFHAALEAVLNEKKEYIRRQIHRMLHKTKIFLLERKIIKYENDEMIFLEHLINENQNDNCFFIVFAPEYERPLKGKLDKNVLNRFCFIHHPLYSFDTSDVKVNKKLVVGIYGNAVNTNAYSIVRAYNAKYDTGKVVFQVKTNDYNTILKEKNVIRILDKKDVTNEELSSARKDFDFILLPYDRKQYRVSASGIWCDAISEGIPVLMLDSPFLKYYNSYGIGKMVFTCDEMAKIIADFSLKNIEVEKIINECRGAELELKETLHRENIDTIKRLMDKC